MKNVIHLIPADGIGGVEIAANSMKELHDKDVCFYIRYIFNSGQESLFFLYNPFQIIKSIFEMVSSKPDLLIVSLWRAALVGIFVKIISPKTKIVLFVHSEKEAHFVDFLITRVMLILADEVWADSKASLSNRFKKKSTAGKAKIISYIARKLHKLPTKQVLPNFIYWGRVSYDKGIDRSLLIFSGILKHYPESHFIIIGSGDRELGEIKNISKKLGLSNSVTFYDNLDFNKIQSISEQSSFYLQASLFEGMGLSVVEAMQLGIVPIVTPVGEMAVYCNDSNSVTIHSNDEAIQKTLMLLSSDKIYQELSNNSASTWANKEIYKDSVINECKRILEV